MYPMLVKYIEDRVVKDVESGCWLWRLSKNAFGYGQCSNSWPAKLYGKTRAHNISFIAFYGRYNKVLWVLHKCTSKACVSPNHLYLGNAKDNRADAYRDGTAKVPDNRGEKCGTSKLTSKDVLEIRQVYPYLNTVELGRLYGVCRQQIGDIVRRKKWGHL